MAYSGHHWKRIQGLASRWALFQVTYHNVGFHVSSPKEVLRRIDIFNRMLDSHGREGNPELKLDLRDIGDFFTNVPRDRMMAVIRKYQEKTAAKDPDAIYF